VSTDYHDLICLLCTASIQQRGFLFVIVFANSINTTTYAYIHTYIYHALYRDIFQDHHMAEEQARRELSPVGASDDVNIAITSSGACIV